MPADLPPERIIKGNTKVHVQSDDTIDIDVNGVNDFIISANDFTAISGSVISTDTINETTADTGVTIDTLLIKDNTLGSATAEIADAYFGDGAIIYLGDDQDVTLTHVADTGLTLNLKLTAANLTDSALTAGRVVFAGASGLLADDADMTFATDTLTATKMKTTELTLDMAQDYKFNADPGGSGFLNLQSQTSGLSNTFELFTKDGDGTDSIILRLYSVGTPGSIVNREKLVITYIPGEAQIFTEADGTGTLRPIVLYTEGNTDQLKLNIDGSVSMSGALGMTGTVSGANAAAYALLNVAATSTVPTLVPNKADTDTGLGWNSTDRLSFIAGSHEILSIREAGAAGDTAFLSGGSLNTGGVDDKTIYIATDLNDAGAAGGTDLFNLIKGNITETSIVGWNTINLIDLQVDTVSKFKVSRTGALTLGAGAVFAGALSGITTLSMSGLADLNGGADIEGSVTIDHTNAAASLIATRAHTFTDSLLNVAVLLHKTTADMIDGFGPGLLFQVTDSGVTGSAIGSIGVARSGADNSGKIVFYPYSAGTGQLALTLNPDKSATFGAGATLAGVLTMPAAGTITAATSLALNSPIVTTPAAGAITMGDVSVIQTGVTDNDYFSLSAWDKDGTAYTELLRVTGGINTPTIQILGANALSFGNTINQAYIYNNGGSGRLTFGAGEYVEISAPITKIPLTYSLQFRDAAIYINSVDDGHLDLTADISIDLNSVLTQNTGIIGNTNQATTLAGAADTLAVTKDFVTLTGDGGGNTLATITGGVTGQHLTILFVDALVTITDTDAATADTIDLRSEFVSAANYILELLYDGNKWFEYARSPSTRNVPATGKIADITHADTDEHSLTLAQLNAVYAGTFPENTRVIYVGGTKIAGTGTLNLHSVSGQKGVTIVTSTAAYFYAVLWYRAADGLFYYSQTVANDDWDVYALGYQTGDV